MGTIAHLVCPEYRDNQERHFSGVVPIEFSAQPFTVRVNLNIGDAL